MLLAGLSRLLPRSGLSSLLPRPETLLRWHRRPIRHRWAAFRQRSPRPRRTRDPTRRECVLRLAEENPRWGYRRIQGEALKLGFRISHMGVGKILRSRGIPPAPRRSQTTWRQFVRQHAAQMLATDFLRSRRPGSSASTSCSSSTLPVARCTSPASRPARPGSGWPSKLGTWLEAKFLLRDRDSKFTAGFDHVFGSEGVEVLKLPYRAPRANSIAERFVGTCRREVLDHLLIFSAHHLEAVIKQFLAHYHHARPHQGLQQRCPEPLVLAPIPLPVGRQIVRHNRLGGLLHEYSWAA